MSYADWKDKKDAFRKVDVRGVAGNFLEGLAKQAASLAVGDGIFPECLYFRSRTVFSSSLT